MTTSQRLHPDLVATLKTLRLGKLVPVIPDRLRLAREKGLDLEDALLLVLSDEVQRRANMRVQNRSREAGLQSTMVFEEWDTTATIDYDRALLERLRSL